MDIQHPYDMQNKAIDSAGIDYFYKKLKYPHRINPLNKDGTYKTLNNILKNTITKRGCCGMRSMDHRNYVNHNGKSIEIIKDMCDLSKKGYTVGSNYCDNFYTIYCKNIIDDYKKKNSGNFNYQHFSHRNPECACYAPIPPQLKHNVPIKCYMP
jgi:hypothetical protein